MGKNLYTPTVHSNTNMRLHFGLQAYSTVVTIKPSAHACFTYRTTELPEYLSKLINETKIFIQQINYKMHCLERLKKSFVFVVV